MLNNQHGTSDPSQQQILIAFALTFGATLSYFLYINWDSFFLVLYESGDFATMSLDVLQARKLELLISSTSSQGVFRQPGPFLGYWYALWEFVFCSGLGFPSPVIVHGIATAILNLIFQFTALLIVYLNLRNKRLIILCGLFLFLFLHTIVENQLAFASPIMIAVSAFLLLSLSSAHAITHRGFAILPIFAIAFTLCFHSHAVFGLTAIALSLPVFFKILRTLLSKSAMIAHSKDKIYLSIGVLIILTGFYPILYDEFFDTGNLSSIWTYIRSSSDISFLARINLYFGKALLFVSTFFVDMFWSKDFKLGLIISDSYMTTPTISALVWFLFGSVGVFSLSGRSKEDRFAKALFVLIAIGVGIGIYTAMGKTGAGRIFSKEYICRYLLGFVAGFGLCLIFCLDWIYSKYLNYSANWNKGFVKALAASVFVVIGAVPLLLFPESKTFFSKHADHNSGYFVLHPAVSTDPRIGEIVSAIVRSGNRFDIQVEADQWPLLAGITARLMRLGYPVAINNETYSHAFKLKQRSVVLSDAMVDSNLVADSDEGLYFGKTLAIGQSFTPSASGRISSASFYLKTNGNSPGGAVQVYIYAHSGVLGVSSIPMGANVLAVSNALPASSLIDSYRKIAFKFSHQDAVYLSEGEAYVAVMMHHNGTDGSVIFMNGTSTMGSTHLGNLSSLASASATWGAEPSRDLKFEVRSTLSEAVKVYLSGKAHPLRKVLYADQNTVISIN